MERVAFTSAKFRELNIAHNSTLLICTKSRDLARKLRPEFAKCIVIGEPKDLINAIKKKNSDPELPGIDVIFLEFEPLNTLKTLDYINKRHKNPETSKMPVIATVILLSSQYDTSDTREQIYICGGASRILTQPCAAKDVLYGIIEAVGKCKLVEGTFSDLTAKSKVKKYPFLPMYTGFNLDKDGLNEFDTNDDNINTEDNNNNAITTTRKDVSKNGVKKKKAKDNNSNSTNELLSEDNENSTQVTDIVDDWTDSSSLLPGFVKELRNVESTRRNQLKVKEESAIRERHTVDKAIMNTIDAMNDGQVNLPPGLEAGDDVSVYTEDGNINNNRDGIDIGTAAIKYALMHPNDDSDKNCDPWEAEISTTRRKMDTTLEEKVKVKKEFFSLSCESLLDPRRRPRWGIGNTISSMLHERTDKGIGSDHADSMHEQQHNSSSVNDMEIRPFIVRPSPNPASEHTIAGLDKKIAENCWNIVHSRNHGHNHSSKNTHYRSPHTDKKDQGDDEEVPELPMTFPDVVSLATVQHAKSLLTNSISNQSSTSLPPSLTSHIVEKNSLQKSIKAIDKAQKIIRKIVREAPPDLNVIKLLEVDFNQRNCNLAEKELFETGRKYENEGETDLASLYYSRAGLHSREQQLSQIFIGVLLFKQGKFMAANINFNNAIDILQRNAKKGIYNVLDDFLAYYNRGIVNFRLGDDEQGILDLHHATILCPNNLDARDVYAIALRRVQRFHESIEIVAENRKKKLEKEFEIEKEKKKLLEMKQKLKNEKLAALALEHSQNSNNNFNNNKATDATTDILSQHHHRHQPNSITLSALPNQSNGTANTFIAVSQDSSQLPSSNESPTPTPPSSPGKPRGAKSFKGTIPAGGSGNSAGGNGGISKASERKSSSFYGVKAVAAEEEVPSHCVYMPIDDTCDGSFKSRLAYAKSHKSKNGGDSGTDGAKSLRAFKLLNGYKMDLFESIFIKPTPLQIALACAPYLRKEHHLEAILVCLRLMPLLRSLDHAALMQLSSHVEYRTITTSGALLNQDQPSSACCFLLRGSVEMSVEGGGLSSSVSVGEIRTHDAFGHIDLLFKNPESSVVQEWIRKIEKDGKESSNNIDINDENTLFNDTASIGGDSNSKDDTSTNFSKIKNRDRYRCLKPGMFASYTCSGLIELLLIDENLFEKIIFNAAAEEFQRRIEIIDSCGLFKKWSIQEKIRLARMGQTRTYKAGELIIEQDVQPNYIYFIMKGMCKAYKRPNRTEIFHHILDELKEKALKHDLKYVYHHKLRKIIKPAPHLVVNTTSTSTSTSTNMNHHHHHHHHNSQSNIHHNNHHHQREYEPVESVPDNSPLCATEIEVDRYNLGLEIARYEALAQKAELQESKDAAEADEASTVVGAASDKLCEISTLQWPMLFGEACVLDPDEGRSKGSIYSDTTCEFFLIHKTQMQTFLIQDSLLEDVKIRSVKYPGDSALISKLEKQKEWKKYREDTLKAIPKGRWTKDGAEEQPFVL